MHMKTWIRAVFFETRNKSIPYCKDITTLTTGQDQICLVRYPIYDQIMAGVSIPDGPEVAYFISFVYKL